MSLKKSCYAHFWCGLTLHSTELRNICFQLRLCSIRKREICPPGMVDKYTVDGSCKYTVDEVCTFLADIFWTLQVFIDSLPLIM